MKNREDARTKYEWGNKLIAKGGTENTLKAIDFYQKCLFSLRTIEKSELVDEDNTNIRDALEALLQSINKLLCLSTDWSQIVDTLGRFLNFYLDSAKILNKTSQRLPRLNTLELKIDGPITVLSSKAPSRSEEERLKNYIAIISLFHDDMSPEKNHSLFSDDAVITQSFNLYKKALGVLNTTVKVEPLAQQVEALAVKALSPRAEPRFFSAQQQPNSTAKPPTPNQASPVIQHKVTILPVFEYIAPDDPKREYIRKLIAEKKYDQALAGFHRIMNHIAEDFRCAFECQIAIADDHSRNNQFPDAIKFYLQAFQDLTYIQNSETVALDIANTSKAFKSIVNAINNVIEIYPSNFLVARKCIDDFLNFYLDRFLFLNRESKTPSCLDEINIDNFIACLNSSQDEMHRELTRIYLTVIVMFRQNSKLEKGSLLSMISEIEIKKEMWTDEIMMSTFRLFEKALNLAKSHKGHQVISPELNAAKEPDQKRTKTSQETSSSSYIPDINY